MSGQRLHCDSCGWTAEVEKGATLEDAHTNCPGTSSRCRMCTETHGVEACDGIPLCSYHRDWWYRSKRWAAYHAEARKLG